MGRATLLASDVAPGTPVRRAFRISGAVTMPDLDEQQTPFSLDWLAAALGREPQLTICDRGHLRIRGNTCWTPVKFAGQALVCRIADPH